LIELFFSLFLFIMFFVIAIFAIGFALANLVKIYIECFYPCIKNLLLRFIQRLWVKNV